MAIGQSGLAARIAAARNEAIQIGLMSPWPDQPLTDGLTYALIGARHANVAAAPAPVIGSADADVLTGTPGAELIQGLAGNDRLEGGQGADTLDGGLGTDTAVFRLDRDWAAGTPFDGTGVGTGQDVMLDSGDGQPRQLRSIENLEVHGFTQGATVDNVITTGSGADTIIGGPGDDILNGGPGADSLVGGAGDDVYYVDSLFDRVVEAPGEGYDTVFTTVPFTLGPNVEALYLSGGVVSGTGNASDNLIVGDMGGNLLRGMAGNDHLLGYDGNDRLDGGAGNDTLDGGTGINTAIFHLDTDWQPGRAFNASAIGPAGGTLTFDGGPGNLDTLINIQRVEVTGFSNAANNLVGSAGNDLLIGGRLDDVLNGGAGADAMAGGAGNDTYFVDNILDVVVERPGEGYDSVISSVLYTLSPNVEALTLTGLAYSGTGNEGDNVLTGSDRGNRLRGMGGNDTLLGLGGNDVLQGGAGNDLLQGGDGADTLDGGTGADTLTGGTGADTFLLRKGEAAGDVLTDFTTGEDHLQLTGWGAGTTLTQTDTAAHLWTITDGVDGTTASLTILGDVHAADVLYG